ncbi:MAG TPA: LysR family transcriptional regulator, partial [Acinetobacter nosocomialis]|nr:LysR family transcriptional regulator [Acinetobacter nosocomialis]
QLLLEHARHIPKLVQDVSQGKTGQLNIGFTSSAGLHPLISLVLRSYREMYPAVQTKLEEAGSQKQLDWLISEKLDIAFLRAPISRDIGLKHLHILDEPMVVALPIGHPLTQKKKISLSNLSEENFVLYRRSSGQGLYDNILYSCYQAGFSPRIIQEAPRPTATLNLVAAGIGISIVPASMHNFWDHEIVYREFDDSIKLNAPIYLITRENEKSAKVSNFIELMQKLLPTMT